MGLSGGCQGWGPVGGWGCWGHLRSAVLPRTEEGSTPRHLPLGPGRKGMVSGPGGSNQVGWGPPGQPEPQHQGAWTPGPGSRASLPGPWLQTNTGHFAQTIPAGTELRPRAGERASGKVPLGPPGSWTPGRGREAGAPTEGTECSRSGWSHHHELPSGCLTEAWPRAHCHRPHPRGVQGGCQHAAVPRCPAHRGPGPEDVPRPIGKKGPPWLGGIHLCSGPAWIQTCDAKGLQEDQSPML